jgi:predicted hotdog family 3-hydroxylacyl-ACP dehydratase
MNGTAMVVEDFLPHRGRMKLVDEIIAVDEERAVTLSKVTEQWPFFDGKSVNSLVLIELVAQTAGVCNCWNGIRTQGDKFVKKGWLVGIKHSRFFVDAIPLDTRIITSVENQFKLENFREIAGTATIDSKPACEITLQLVQADSEGSPSSSFRT